MLLIHNGCMCQLKPWDAFLTASMPIADLTDVVDLVDNVLLLLLAVFIMYAMKILPSQFSTSPFVWLAGIALQLEIPLKPQQLELPL